MREFEKLERPVERVFIHCSASNQAAHDDIVVIRGWHQERGWSDVGYHYFIRSTGEIQLGRNLERRPAAQAPHNARTIAICLHGLEPGDFTEAQFDALRDLCGAINDSYDNGLTFHGHNEVANKLCPVFDYRQVLGLDSVGRMVVPGPKGHGVQAPTTLPLLELTHRGDAVALLQKLLNRWRQSDAEAEPAGLAEDGIFGQMTLAALLRFQAVHEVEKSGKATPRTWGLLIAQV